MIGFLSRERLRKPSSVFWVIVIFYLVLFRPPLDFPKGETVVIEEGLTLGESAEVLKEKNIIISSFLFTVFADLFNGKAVAGAYLFDEPLSVFEVAGRVSSGDYRVSLIKVTFPEGLSAKEMALICQKSLPLCEAEEFTNLGEKEEGYLFPDTYFFSQSSNAEEVVFVMRKTFDHKTAGIESSIGALGRSLDDVVITASILEKEAQSMEDRRVVAGILWKRLELGLPLQVDAVFGYVIGKTTFELTSDDLKIDSPYNTYRFLGLPPTAIGNPGLEAIEAALTPISTQYFFYLTDKNGVFHYAEDHDEHVLNKEKYLR